MPLMCRIGAGVSVAVLLLLACVATASVRVTFISDVHLDPLYGTATGYATCTTPEQSVWGVSGCDSSPQLLQLALDDVSEQNTSFIFYGGDWQRHRFRRTGLSPTSIFGDMSQRFRNVTVDGSMGTVAFTTSLGNTDMVPNYHFAWDSAASEEDLAARVQAMETEGLLTADEAAVMTRCGYYTHEMETMNVIVLHTLLWAYRLDPAVASSVSDPCDQFAFLESELAKAQAAGKRVVVHGHIPPGVEARTVIRRGSFLTADADVFWRVDYQAAYDALIAQYKDIVAVQLFSHTHRFGLQYSSTIGVAAVVMTAISPRRDNHPSYMLADFSDAGWVLQDMQMRYVTSDGVFHAGMSVRESLNFTADLGSFNASRATVLALATDDAAWANYLVLFGGNEYIEATLPVADCGDFCRFVLVCSMLESDYDLIKACVADLEAASSSPAVASSSAVAGSPAAESSSAVVEPPAVESSSAAGSVAAASSSSAEANSTAPSKAPSGDGCAAALVPQAVLVVLALLFVF